MLEMRCDNEFQDLFWGKQHTAHHIMMSFHHSATINNLNRMNVVIRNKSKALEKLMKFYNPLMVLRFFLWEPALLSLKKTLKLKPVTV